MFEQEVDLVFHQRNERRDDDRQAVEHQCRQLVAQTLAAGGRKNGQHGPAVQETRNNFRLAVAKLGEAEDLCIFSSTLAVVTEVAGLS